MNVGSNAHQPELRKHPRLSARIKVGFKLSGGLSAVKHLGRYEAYSRNISEGGIFLELFDLDITHHHNVALDDLAMFKSTIELEIELPGNLQPVKAQGKVVWIERHVPGQEYHHGVAIAFTGTGPEALLPIRHYVEEKRLAQSMKV